MKCLQHTERNQQKSGKKESMKLNQKRRLFAPEEVRNERIYREGLHSYFRRLCEYNYLKNNTVIAEIMDPFYTNKWFVDRKMRIPVYLINSGGEFSERFASRLRKISNLSNIQSFTLEKLYRMQGVSCMPLEKGRQWCPQCYKEDLDKLHGPYDRLIWSISDVKICTEHNCYLESRCRTCGKSKLPWLLGNDISGFCSNCFSWLGGRGNEFLLNRDEHSCYMSWAAKSWESLLDSDGQVPTDVSKNIRLSIQELVGRHFEGKYSWFAKAIDRNKSVVVNWKSYNNRPKWEILMDISYVFQVPIIDLLSADPAGISLSSTRTLPSFRKSPTRKRPEKLDLKKASNLISGVSEGKIPGCTTLEAVAKRLKTDTRTLRNKFPEEVRELSAVLKKRRALERTRKKQAREGELRKLVPMAVHNLLECEGKVTRRGLEHEMTRLGLPILWSESPLIREIKHHTLEQMKLELESGTK